MTAVDLGTTDRTRFVALDALRGLAVVAVVAYHAFPGAVPAGFLGVSVFFTLSGFLITHLLLDEHARRGGIDLVAFWGRRLRRLMPTALVGLSAIVVLWGASGWLSAEVAGDVGAALAYLANVRFLATATVYGGDAASSPVMHFWSLAIEEQFYLVFPVVAWAALRTRWSVRALAVAVAVLVAASAAMTALWAGQTMTVYFSTTTRAAEILLGAVAALVLHRWPRLAASPVTGGAAVVSLVVLIAAALRTGLDQPAYSHGALLLVGVVSTVLVVGATAVRSLPRPLGPLVALGSISYALYVVHWPLLMVLRERGISSVAAKVAVIAASIVLAWVTTSRLEGPVRARRWDRRRVRAAALACTSFVAAAALVGSQVAPSVTGELAAAAEAVDELTARSEAAHRAAGGPGRALVSPSGLVPEPVTMLVLGDSTAAKLADSAQFVGDPRLRPLGGYTELGCAIARGGERRADIGGEGGQGVPLGDCDWDVHWLHTVERVGGADVALVAAGLWETTERRIPGATEGWVSLDDPAYVEHLYREMLDATDALVGAGVGRVVWTTVATNPQRDLPTFDRRRAVLNDLFRRLAEERPDTAAVIDLASHLDAPENLDLRPDGVHVGVVTGRTLWETWLVDQVLDVARPAPEG